MKITPITKFTQTVFLLIVFSTGQMGCEIEGANEDDYIKEAILPMAGNNSWQYSQNFADEDTTLTYTLLLADSLAVGTSSAWFVTTNSTSGYPAGSFDATWFYSYGYALAALDIHNNGTTVIYRKFPFKENETWEVPTYFYLPGLIGADLILTDFPYSITGVSTSTTVTTNAGTFDCVVYHYAVLAGFNNEFTDVFEYFAPGVGLVAIGYSPNHESSDQSLPTFGDQAWDWTKLESYHLE